MTGEVRLRDTTPAVEPAPARRPDSPEKIRDAAQQFESLLIGQLLKSMRGEGGWLGTGDDAAGDCAAGFAEQQLAAAMAAAGGLGLAGLISSGLHQPPRTK